MSLSINQTVKLSRPRTENNMRRAGRFIMPSSAVAQDMMEVIFKSQVCSASVLDYTEVNRIVLILIMRVRH